MPLFRLDLLTDLEPGDGAPGTVPASRQTDASNEPGRVSIVGLSGASEKQEIVPQSHFVFLRNTRTGPNCAILTA